MTGGEDAHSTPKVSIREATLADAADVAEVYNLYVTTSAASFEMEPVSAETMANRIAKRIEHGQPWLVAELSGQLVGFAFAKPFRPRAGYNRTIETSIYISPSTTGQGVGRTLYERLLGNIRALGFHVAIATIALPNDASVALHESFGFTKVALLPQVGRKFDRWVDVGYWHLTLE